jgi:hypothetical protein
VMACTSVKPPIFPLPINRNENPTSTLIPESRHANMKLEPILVRCGKLCDVVGTCVGVGWYYHSVSSRSESTSNAFSSRSVCALVCRQQCVLSQQGCFALSPLPRSLRRRAIFASSRDRKPL